MNAWETRGCRRRNRTSKMPDKEWHEVVRIQYRPDGCRNVGVRLDGRCSNTEDMRWKRVKSGRGMGRWHVGRDRERKRMDLGQAQGVLSSRCCRDHDIAHLVGTLSVAV